MVMNRWKADKGEVYLNSEYNAEYSRIYDAAKLRFDADPKTLVEQGIELFATISDLREIFGVKVKQVRQKGEKKGARHTKPKRRGKR